MKHSAKRGLSDVVTTVLIILLVLAAVALIWGYLRSSLNEGGQQIAAGASCLGLDLKVKSCTYDLTGTKATVVYERSGDATLKNVTVLIYASDGTSSSNNTASIAGAGEAKIATFGGVASKPVNAAVVGSVSDPTGNVVTCQRSDLVPCN